MPHPWSCGWLSGPGAARAQPPPPGEPLPAESGGICGRVPQLQRGPERRGEQSGAGGGWERGGWEAFFLHLPFFFFFFSTRKARENPTKPPAQMFEGISAKPECCKAVPADAGGFAGVPGSELDQVLKQTCSEESGKMQRDMHCFG